MLVFDKLLRRRRGAGQAGTSAAGDRSAPAGSAPDTRGAGAGPLARRRYRLRRGSFGDHDLGGRRRAGRDA